MAFSSRAMCRICDDPLEDDFAALNCGHTFHGTCLGRWLQSSITCPLCRLPCGTFINLFEDSDDEQDNKRDSKDTVTEEEMSGVQEQMSSAVESAKEAAASVGERVTDFLQGSPFSTPCGRKIEMATDATMLATENWGLNMEICDFINNTAEGGRDAIRAIRKRLYSQISKNNAIVMYTLTVLETCVKNCDVRFHELVCQKEFINDLVKLIGPKFDAPQIIQERVLSLIQSWSDAFRGDPRLQGVCQVYDELKAKGVEFPMTDLDSMAPIITPKRTVFSVEATESAQPVSGTAQWSSEPNPGAYHFVDPSQPVQPSPEQLEKLRKELDIANGNLKVFREMLSELPPGKEEADDVELLTELSVVCKQMQLRVLDLIRSIVNEEVTYELLVLNDEFNNVFEKFDRYMANRLSGAAAAGPGGSTAELIDLQDRSLSQQLGALSMHGHDPKVAATYADNSSRLDQTSAGLATAAFNKTAPVSEREAAEMAQWLEAQEAKGAANTSATETDSLLSKGSPAKEEENAGL